jgi:nucleoside-diphosphate-sugar epimerase
VWNSQRILVTGAGGFLGRALCARLLALGAQVHGSQRRRPVPEGVHRHPIPPTGPTGPALSALVTTLRPQVVFHLGSPVNPDRAPQRFEEMQQGVLATTDAVARACLGTSTRLVHVGTCEVYGDGPTPFREDQALRPVSPYSAAKAAADLWVQTLMRTQGLKASIARPFLSYGPTQRSGALIPTAIAAALAGAPFPMTQGTQTRELNFISDMVQALLLTAGPEAVGQTLNLCCGQEHSVREIVERIYHLAEADPALVQVGALPHRAGESSRFYGDPSRIQALGYKAKVSLDQGLLACIAAART